MTVPCTAHLGCCEHACWLPRLPEPGRARENPSLGLWLWSRARRVAGKNPPSTTSAPAAASLRTPTSRPRSAGVRARDGWVRFGARLQAARDTCSQSLAWGHHSPWLGHVTVHPSVTSEPIARRRHRPWLRDVTTGHPRLQRFHTCPLLLQHSIPQLLSCARHQSFTPVPEASAMSPGAPSGRSGRG